MEILKRTNRVVILLADKELKELKERAENSGLSLSGYVRSILLKNK